jgi:hypothetical protein
VGGRLFLSLYHSGQLRHRPSPQHRARSEVEASYRHHVWPFFTDRLAVLSLRRITNSVSQQSRPASSFCLMESQADINPFFELKRPHSRCSVCFHIPKAAKVESAGLQIGRRGAICCSYWVLFCCCTQAPLTFVGCTNGEYYTRQGSKQHLPA